ncbi:hypothetical protein HDU87_003113 [Geranomyces variabilis]|uniref:ubiquitinyl hydrolase 1 n=1 Tax=Geranomyces variabilis TaxID=109894 RepID=A0AAD5TL13_9FUNG|nr:hypothetical protein HDU87_003113 [Geranomyces variabilis]
MVDLNNLFRQVSFGELGPAPLPMSIVEYMGTRNDPKLYVGGIIFGAITVKWPGAPIKPPAMGKPVVLPLGADWTVASSAEPHHAEVAYAAEGHQAAGSGDDEPESQSATVEKNQEFVEQALTSEKYVLPASNGHTDRKSGQREVFASDKSRGTLPTPLPTPPSPSTMTHRPPSPPPSPEPLTAARKPSSPPPPITTASKSPAKSPPPSTRSPNIKSPPPKSPSTSPTLSSKMPPPAAPAPAPAKGPASARSWADLAKAPPTNGAKPSAIIVPPRRPSVPNGTAPSMAVTYTGHLIHPRGLLNPGNLCYQNAVLQALLHCRPLYNLLRTVGLTAKHALGAKPTVLQAVLMFLAEFPEDAPGTELKQTGTDEGAFAPEYIYTALQETGYFEKAAKGRQEDAQEYLGFLLDALHEELLAMHKASSSPTSTVEPQPQSWVEVGKKNKALETVVTALPTSAISNIFAGRFRSVVRCAGRKDSINVQPFEILPLDIAPDAVQTIENALMSITAPEVLEGFCTPSRTNRTGTATKQLSIEKLPPVIVLHVKRFRYDQARGAQKLMKYVRYGAELKIAPEILAPSTRPTNPTNTNPTSASATTPPSPSTPTTHSSNIRQPEYRLFAVVYHHGKHAAGGHYTADVQRSSGEWLRFDDTLIAKIEERDVIAEKRDRQAYMLFYVRS